MLMDTLSLDTRVNRTYVIIIAVSGSVHTSCLRVAAIDEARIVFIANSLLVLTSKDYIAGVDGALVVIVAISWNVLAFTGIWDARVDSAYIVVIAVFSNSKQTFGKCAAKD
jgi:hypothetical protein